jgi:hypothetical protein
MKNFALLTIGTFGIFGMMAIPSAKGDERNMETNVTFNQPVEVPGHVLAAGAYTFKLADPINSNDIVEICGKDGNAACINVLAIRDLRLTPADKTVMTLEERTAGAPEAVKSWFYPGSNWGEQFVYHAPRVQKAD